MWIRGHLQVLIAACLLSIGCASGGAGSNARSSNVQPPRIVSRTGPLQLRVSGAGPAGGTTIIDVEVMVDANGVPDMSTFRATGSAGAENRGTLMQWISEAKFEPGRRDGVPVASLFRTTIRLRR
jgi:hypothetical protein